ncbi:MAG: hypothetical protein IKT78_02855 [Ruminiclostridium sp.]|nr:hypothetical protein [Ruminiclostridium sp.]
MKKKRYKGLIIAVAVIAAIVALVMWVIYIIPGSYSKDNAQKLLSRNEDEFVLVTEYLSGYGQSSASISEDRETIFIFDGSSGRHEEITDRRVKKAIDRLFFRGVDGIYWDGENSTHFLVWRRFMDFGAGIVCSDDSSKEPYVHFLTKAEELSLDGWYYYEADYNKWRENGGN